MGPWVNYHHLYYFKTIAEEGTVSRAAQRLRLGQPTLSAQLKQFELALGVPLFERQHKRLILTEQGRVALEYAKSIFRMGSEMVEVLHDRLKPLVPTLHVGALDGVPKQVVLGLVQQALALSRCQITLSEGRLDELLRELGAHRVDLVVSNFLPMGTDARGFYPRRIARKPVAFYGAHKYKRLRRGFPASLSGVAMIVPTYDSKLRQDLDHWAKLHKVELNVVVESQDISVKKLLAIDGVGIVPTASHAVRGQLERGELIELGKLKNVYEELYVLTAQRKIAHPIASVLAERFFV